MIGKFNHSTFAQKFEKSHPESPDPQKLTSILADMLSANHPKTSKIEEMEEEVDYISTTISTKTRCRSSSISKTRNTMTKYVRVGGDHGGDSRANQDTVDHLEDGEDDGLSLSAQKICFMCIVAHSLLFDNITFCVLFELNSSKTAEGWNGRKGEMGIKRV